MVATEPHVISYISNSISYDTFPCLQHTRNSPHFCFHYSKSTFSSAPMPLPFLRPGIWCKRNLVNVFCNQALLITCRETKNTFLNEQLKKWIFTNYTREKTELFFSLSRQFYKYFNWNKTFARGVLLVQYTRSRQSKLYRISIIKMLQTVNYKYCKYKLYLHTNLFIKFKFINIVCYYSGFWHVCGFQLT